MPAGLLAIKWTKWQGGIHIFKFSWMVTTSSRGASTFCPRTIKTVESEVIVKGDWKFLGQH
jgi:hypothetical protein